MTTEKQSSNSVPGEITMKTVNILLNGELRQVAVDNTLYNLVQQEKLSDRQVVIAINNLIIPHHQWSHKSLVEDDNVSIFQVIAGG